MTSDLCGPHKNRAEYEFKDVQSTSLITCVYKKNLQLRKKTLPLIHFREICGNYLYLTLMLLSLKQLFGEVIYCDAS